MQVKKITPFTRTRNGVEHKDMVLTRNTQTHQIHEWLWT